QPMDAMRGRDLHSFIYAAILAAMCPWADAYAASIPDCAGQVEIARAHVMRVEQNGVLVLRDGRAVILEGIRLAEQDSQHDQALAALRALTADGTATFTATPPKEDRYDRVRVQGFTSGGAWLQAALLEKGLARVAIAPDRSECAPDLYEAEGRAREHQSGLWALSVNAPRRAEAMPSRRHMEAASAAEAPRRTQAVTAPETPAGSFQLVEGWVTHVAQADGRTFIDFGSNGRQSFSAIIQPEDRRAFRGFDLEGLEAHRIRIRGIIQDYRGRPEIALSNPAQIEVLN
ncbi:MAG TPA: thermonuclease family protein, partial [Rhizomicrobium sp.]|nr:thermonuclease family protein [Rhizomicrobium sp.]